MASIPFIFRIASVSQWRSRIRFSFSFFASFITATKFNQKLFFFLHSFFVRFEEHFLWAFSYQIKHHKTAKCKKRLNDKMKLNEKRASTRMNGTWRWRGKTRKLKVISKSMGTKHQRKKREVNCLFKRSAMNNFSLFSQRRNFAIHYYYYYHHYCIDGHT